MVLKTAFIYLRIALWVGTAVFGALGFYFKKRQEKQWKSSPRVRGEFTGSRPGAVGYIAVGFIGYCAVFAFTAGMVLARLAMCPDGAQHILPRAIWMIRFSSFGLGTLFVGLAVRMLLLQGRVPPKLVLDGQGIHEFGPQKEAHFLWASIRDVEMKRDKPGIQLLLEDGTSHRLIGYHDFHELASQVAERVSLGRAGLNLPVEFGYRHFRLAALAGFAVVLAIVPALIFQLFTTWNGPLSNTVGLFFIIALLVSVPTYAYFGPIEIFPGWIKVTRESVELKSLRRTWSLPLSEIRLVDLVTKSGRLMGVISTVAGETLRVPYTLNPVKLMRSILLAKETSKSPAGAGADIAV